MKAYSTDLREKIALLYATHDYTLDEVAELFGIGRRSVIRFVRKHRAGLSLAPLPHAGGFPARLSTDHLSALRAKVTDTPDATLAELASYLKITAQAQVHLSTVCRALQKLGLPRKKRHWPPPKEMRKHASLSASGLKRLIAANSSLLMKQAFIWLLSAPLAVLHVGSGSSAQCPSTGGAIIL